jgi:hypothetical protein
VYQSSPAKKVSSWLVGWLWDANLRAASWNGKSSTACILSWVLKCEVKFFVVSKTSPNMKNSRLPCWRANRRTSGPNFCQNSSLTCFIVSMRKPSTPKSAIHVL